MAESEDKKISVQEKSPVDTGGAETLSGSPTFNAPVDIWEDEKGLTIEAEMPGVDVNGLTVHLKDSVLTITGKLPQQEEKGKLLKQEYDEGDFERRINVPDLINQEGITAKLKDGVLEVYLPKQAPAQPRKISVTSE
jgi:HSP20 family protein